MHARVATLIATLTVVLIGAFVRGEAVTKLPIDFDEDDYLRSAQVYASAFQAGDASVLLRENPVPEAPPLGKIVYGAAIAPLPQAPVVPARPTTSPPASDLPEPHLTVARATAALFGVLAVLLLALVDPLSGLLLAVNTWNIKYTSQVMLESLPAFLSLAAVVSYLRARAWPRPRAWLVVSGIALGLAVAAKYPYAIVGVAIAIDRLWAGRREPARAVGSVALLGAVAIGGFALGDPYLWPDPAGRLAQSLAFHPDYAAGVAARENALPWWQTVAWLSQSVPWHPGVFRVAVDQLISLLALVGLPRAFRERRVFAIWLVVAFLFLLAWPVKWPQYLLLLTAPLALVAADGIRTVGGLVGLVVANARGGSSGAVEAS